MDSRAKFVSRGGSERSLPQCSEGAAADSRAWADYANHTLPFLIFLLLGLWLPACRQTSNTLGTVTARPPSVTTTRVSSPAAVGDTPARTPTNTVLPPASQTALPTVYTPAGAPYATPLPSTSTASPPMPAKTPQLTATLQPQPTQPPTATIEATRVLLTLEGSAVSYNGVRFNVDPILGDTVYAGIESIGVVNFTRFAFAPDGWCREVGCVEVYPVEQYQEAFPDRPLPPVGAATILRARDQPLSFQNGNGTRSIRMRGQDGFFANNKDIVYDFAGFTDDGQHYVSIIIPIDAPILLSVADPNENTNAGAIPVPTELPSDYNQLGIIIRDYNREVAGQLDLLAAADFTPSLNLLDAFVTSLQIEARPVAGQLTPTPPATTTAGPFRLVGPIPPALLGEVTGLRVHPDGSLWVLTTYGFMLLRDGRWTMQPSGRAQTLIGVDDVQRMWFFLEDDGSRIYFWDGGPDFTLADAGWMPVPDPARLEGRGLLTGFSGRVWLATNQDVRMFDGARWTLFSFEDMGMIPPANQDISTWFTLELRGDSDQIWVGECDWTGPGPGGGGGARWFDGQTWRGAESPVASGCVTAIQQDNLGRIWVGLDTDLWRYDPATGEWERFAPPQPPEGYRFLYITDLALDPAGDPWPLFPRCGGASCVGAELRYRLHEGEWVQIGEPSGEPQTLVFDGEGTPWLFLDRRVYRIQDDYLAQPLVAEFRVDAVTVDGAGRIWVAGAKPGGETALWVLESGMGAADSLAVCPLPGEEQPPPIKVVEGQSIVEMFEPQILAYLNARGDARGLQTALSGLVLTDSSGTDWQARTQVFSTDVTGDTTPEVVVDLSFFVEGQFANGALFVYRCQAGQYVGDAVTLIGAQVFSDSDPDPGIRAIQDMNGNGKSEIVFSYIIVAGTHANFTREFRIIEWDGRQFADLIRSDRERPYAAEVLNGDGELRDAEGEGILELELTHGAGHDLTTSVLDRGYVDVWAWDGEAVTLTSTKAAPPAFRIHAVWDGDSATKRGDYDSALAFYQQAIFDEGLLGWSADYVPGGVPYDATSTDPNERPRLSAYGRYRILLLHVVRGYLPEAQIVYDTLREKFPEGAIGGQYAALATIFWDEYSNSGDITAACDKAIDYAAVHADEILEPLGSSFYGSGQRDYAPEDVCPFR